jgi:hypothetical protein
MKDYHSEYVALSGGGKTLFMSVLCQGMTFSGAESFAWMGLLTLDSASMGVPHPACIWR